MPEHTKEAEPPDDSVGKAAPNDLDAHNNKPQEANENMETVRSHERKECREEAATLPAIAFTDEMTELGDFHAEEYRTKDKGEAEPE